MLNERRGEDNLVLDLGAGSGWLSSFLSTFSEVGNIDTLDSDKYLLTIVLPEIVKLMQGNIAKINPIWGAFYPLLVENEHYDIVIASSAFHHASNLYQTLRECNRVLKKGGLLLILNERPMGILRYFLRVVTFSISAVICLISKNYPEYSAAISKSGILDNPYLGDNTYLYSQWQQSIKKTGFSFKTIVTPYHIYKRRKNQKEKLIHFICRKL